MTIVPVVVFVVAPLAAEIAPASIKLARAPMNAFFTVQLSFNKFLCSSKMLSKLCQRMQNAVVS
jgi:hypothetical protein